MNCRTLINSSLISAVAVLALPGLPAQEKESLAATPAAGAAPQQLDLSKGASGKWKITENKECPGVKFLSGPEGSGMIPFTVPSAGKYSVWVRFYTGKDKAGNMTVDVHAPNGEIVRSELVDAAGHFRRMDPTPQIPWRFERPAGLRWAKFDVSFEYPGVYSMKVGPAFCRDRKNNEGGRFLESIYVASPSLDLPKQHAEDRLSPVASGALRVAPVAAPQGFIPAQANKISVGLYSGVRNSKDWIHIGLAMAKDPVGMAEFGANQFRSPVEGLGAVGARACHWHGGGWPDLAKSIAKPEGRFINSEGTVSDEFSLFYEAATEWNLNKIREDVRQEARSSDFYCWQAVDESFGRMDYSSYAIDKFRPWLTRKYKTIAALNEAWGGRYGDFSEIEPPRKAEDNIAAWLEFRKFTSLHVAGIVARVVDVINEEDPLKRPANSNISNLSFNAVYFMNFGPLAIEDLAAIGFKKSAFFGWDAYAADDFMGMETELVDSLARGKSLFQAEHNVHNKDPRMASRTYWTMISKGLKGIYVYRYYDGGECDDHNQWALNDTVDIIPRDKAGAYSDVFHQVHQLENILGAARRVQPVKQVAIFYNYTDLSLAKTPLSSIYGEPVDSSHHVYEMLRGKGYPVTFLTEKQIREGLLANVGAVVLVDAQHVAPEVCQALEGWTRNGGVLIGDSYPGAYTDLGKRQNSLMKLFGIEPAPPKKVDKIKLEESTQGYGEVTIAALNHDKLYECVRETYHVSGSRHPVAKVLRHWMFSGYGPSLVKQTDGECIGMSGNSVGVLLNKPGRGNSMYVSTLLGTVYGSSATRYEWDSTHSDLAGPRVLDAFLEYAGVKRLSSTDLPERVGYKLRVESPLFDAKGNAVIGLVSFNDMKTPDFQLKVAYPADKKAPQQVFAVVNGSRKVLPLPFKLEKGILELRMPGFNSQAALITVNDAEPLVSVDFPGEARPLTDMLVVNPGKELKAKVTVFNTGSKEISGRLVANLPEGWFYDKASAELSGLAPGQSAELEFKIKAPALCGVTRLRPLSFLFEGGAASSMPATEVVWWKAGNGQEK